MPNGDKGRGKNLILQTLKLVKSLTAALATITQATIPTLGSTDLTTTNATITNGAVTNLSVPTKFTYNAVDLARTMTDINSLLICKKADFTETDVAGVYTAAVTIPTGALVLDVQWVNTALWTNGTAATMKCGDVADDDGIFTGVNVKTTPALGMALSYWRKDVSVGAYAGTKPLLYAAGGTISAVVTTTGAVGSAGRSSLIVTYMLPQALAAATKA